MDLPLFLYYLSILSDHPDSNDEDIALFSHKQITSFVIKASLNGLNKDIKATINQTDKTIKLKSRLPADKKLIATFESFGDVYIDYIKQQSGITANDFCQNTIYTLIARDGSSTTYKLITKV